MYEYERKKVYKRCYDHKKINIERGTFVGVRFISITMNNSITANNGYVYYNSYIFTAIGGEDRSIEIFFKRRDA